MLADAFHAESYRFWRNRTAVLWSVLFVPVMAVVFGGLGAFAVKANAARLTVGTEAPPQILALLAGGPIDLGPTLVSAAAGLASPGLLLFVLIGAATLFAGDYRWETWRLITPRNSRPNLLLGKLATAAVLAVVALLVMLVAALVENMIRAAVFERPLAFSMDAEAAGRLVLLFLLSWGRAVQFLMIGLLAATVTRSLLAALFIPLVVGVAQALSPQLLAAMGITPDAWLAVLVNPGAAIEAIQTSVNPQAGSALPTGLLPKAWLSAILWTALPLAAALAWFRRQDLSKE